MKKMMPCQQIDIFQHQSRYGHVVIFHYSRVSPTCFLCQQTAPQLKAWQVGLRKFWEKQKKKTKMKGTYNKGIYRRTSQKSYIGSWCPLDMLIWPLIPNFFVFWPSLGSFEIFLSIEPMGVLTSFQQRRSSRTMGASISFNENFILA